MKNKKLFTAILVIAVILLIDQWVKFYIKNHFYLGEEINVLGQWFKLHFTENYGMAFGMEFGGKSGKILLTIFRLIAIEQIWWAEEQQNPGSIFDLEFIKQHTQGYRLPLPECFSKKIIEFC